MWTIEGLQGKVIVVPALFTFPMCFDVCRGILIVVPSLVPRCSEQLPKLDKLRHCHITYQIMSLPGQENSDIDIVLEWLSGTGVVGIGCLICGGFNH